MPDKDVDGLIRHDRARAELRIAELAEKSAKTFVRIAMPKADADELRRLKRWEDESESVSLALSGRR